MGSPFYRTFTGAYCPTITTTTTTRYPMAAVSADRNAHIIRRPYRGSRYTVRKHASVGCFRSTADNGVRVLTYEDNRPGRWRDSGEYPLITTTIED